METKTRISNLAYDLRRNIDLNEFQELEFSLNVLKRAIKEYEEKAKEVKK